MDQNVNAKVRVIICGGRHFKDYDRLESTMNDVMSKITPWCDVIEIVSGHCEGADQLGELYAKNHGLPCKVFPAQWKKFGKAAGPIRNSEMVKYASEAEMPVVVAFRSPRTKGTNDTVKKATNGQIINCPQNRTIVPISDLDYSYNEHI